MGLALRTALDGAAAAGADTRVLPLRELDLPLYTPEHHIPRRRTGSSTR